MNIRRGIAALFLVGGLSAAGLATAGPASAASGYYTMVNYGSQMCATVYGDVYGNGTPVRQQPCVAGNTAQIWYPEPTTGGYLHWRNLASGMCLDVRDGRDADRTTIQQWTCNTTAKGMRWWLGSGAFPGANLLLSAISYRCAEVAGGSLVPGAYLQTYHCTRANYAQNWEFRAA
jgi:hypothetical protein